MLTAGQSRALSELTAVVVATNSRITMGTPEEEDRAGIAPILVPITVDCTGTPIGENGVDLGSSREFELWVPADFPFMHPEVRTAHRDFAGLPHVTWTNVICLYLSNNEWDPSHGMRGFLRRLLTWLSRAAAGTLVSVELPWHPPVGAFRSSERPVVVRADLTPDLESDRGFWTAWARLSIQHETYMDVVEWSREPTGPLSVPVVGLSQPVGFLFPWSSRDLRRQLVRAGLNIAAYIEMLSRSVAINGANVSPLLLIGSPAPPGHESGTRFASIQAWDVGERGTRAHWLQVFDQRPSRTRRRDRSRPVNWLAGKRILLLGCGALGAPIAEHCVRAGAAMLLLVDNGSVNPGILIRQPYRGCDIGRRKAEAMADRLRDVADFAPAIFADSGDAIRVKADDLTNFDLVLDATASRAVAQRLERLRREVSAPPPMIAVMVGHDCEHAIATVALTASSGGGVDLLRRLSIRERDDRLTSLREDLYPSLPRTEPFLPEPGCSDPTFVGSAADLGGLAARLLNASVEFLSTASNEDTPTAAAVVLRASLGEATYSHYWPNDVVRRDVNTGYEIRIARAALASMRTEAVRAAQLGRIPKETGGLLLGQIDTACDVVWIDQAMGPPPGSGTSPDGIRLEIGELPDRLASLARRTGGLRSFVGAWHSHPRADPLPSATDADTMGKIVNAEVDAPRAALLIVLGGAAGAWERWLDGTGMPEVHTQMYFPSGRSAEG